MELLRFLQPKGLRALAILLSGSQRPPPVWISRRAILFEQFLADGRCHSGSPAPMQGPLEASHVLRTC